MPQSYHSTDQMDPSHQTGFYRYIAKPKAGRWRQFEKGENTKGEFMCQFACLSQHLHSSNELIWNRKQTF